MQDATGPSDPFALASPFLTPAASLGPSGTPSNREGATALPTENPSEASDDFEALRTAAVEELAHREAEIDRREQFVSEQLATWDRERRAAALQQQERDNDWKERDSALAAKESELAHRLERCERLIAELEAEQQRVETERNQNASGRESLRQEIVAEFSTERQQFDAERERFHGEKQAFRRRIEQHERELAAAKDEIRKGWEAEREQLRRQLTARIADETATERQAFADLKAQWQLERQEELAALDAERQAHERTAEKSRQELLTLRREQEQEFDRRRKSLEAEIASHIAEVEKALQTTSETTQRDLAARQADILEQEAGLEVQRNAVAESLKQFNGQIAAWEAERAAQLADLQVDRESLASDRQSLASAENRWNQEHAARLESFEKDCQRQRAELTEELRLQREAEELRLKAANELLEKQLAERRTSEEQQLASLKSDHAAALANEQAESHRKIEATRIALDEERAVMENRLHFQRAHLDQTREELETARIELEHRLQLGQTQILGLAEQFGRRRRQLDRFRLRLDERERALDRQTQAIREATEELDAMRQSRAADRRAEDEAQRREQQSEMIAIKQMRDDLTLRSEQLAGRQSRLDTLRLELETTHRENLETRLALDEAWVRLTQAVGPDQAKQRLQVIRSEITAHFLEREQDLDRRRALLTEESIGTRRQFEQLETRRRDLTAWLSEQLAAVGRREEELRRWTANLESRDAQSSRDKHQWRNQKTEAESVIRQLLKQLEENEVAMLDSEIDWGENATAIDMLDQQRMLPNATKSADGTIARRAS